MTRTTKDLAHPLWDESMLESRFALGIAARLSQGSEALPHDVSERLRVARERALERASWAPQTGTRLASSVQSSASGQAVLQAGPGWGWGWRLASLLPVVAMVAGLVLIQSEQDSDQTHAAADIDVALLSDDLPPAAYRDAGFAEFLRSSNR